MRSTLMGVETEYALAAIGADGRARERRLALEPIMQEARRRPHLRAANGGVFLASGALLYIDRGEHPEYCTPECLTPTQALRHVRAGDRLMEELAVGAARAAPEVPRIWLSRCNVDHRTRATWGSHESFLHSGFRNLQDPLMAHLVTRILYTGAGGFEPDGVGLRFTLSPRVSFLEAEASSGSTANRGIFHTKDEPLSGVFKRLHLVCGESLCSDTALWLRLATTALVVRLIETGLAPRELIRLSDPLAAMRAVAAHPDEQVPLDTSQGRRSALWIQRRYLALVEARLDSPAMPDWGGEACARWREVLDRLEHDPQSLDDVLDWRIKRALFQRVVRDAGFAWEQLPALNRAMRDLTPMPWLQELEELQPRWRAWLLEHARRRCWLDDPPLAPTLELIDALTQRPGELRLLRDRLHLLDKTFGDLGPGGVFNSLDAAGALNHRLPGTGDAACPEDAPVPAGRALVRSRVVSAMAHRPPGEFTCDWSIIVDHRLCRRLVLDNPFSQEENWQAVVAAPAPG